MIVSDWHKFWLLLAQIAALGAVSALILLMIGLVIAGLIALGSSSMQSNGSRRKDQDNYH